MDFPPSAHQLPVMPDIRLPGYEIREAIGAGGMGRVDKAWQDSLQRWVAIKSIPTHSLNGQLLSAHLKREALATSQLSHPNIVKIFEVASTEDGIYLVLEWVDGVSLQEVLKSGPVNLDTALDITRQIVAALRHAHQRGIIHRDIKPSNILLNDEGHVWVADFGISSVQSAGIQMGTRSSQTLLNAGAAPYMAPERLRGAAAASQQEDVYSLAALFYELLMGHPPQGVFPPLASVYPELGDLDVVLVRALAHAPQSRHTDVSTFWKHLREGAHEPSLMTASMLKSSEPSSAGSKQPQTSGFWQLMLLGLFFFLFQVAFIGLSTEEQFSLPAGPGKKLYDTAMALTSLNVLFIGCWTALLLRSWCRCRHQGDAPSLWTFLLCYIPIVVGIVTIVYMAVSD